jgi:hypothetical protein
MEIIKEADLASRGSIEMINSFGGRPLDEKEKPSA